MTQPNIGDVFNLLANSPTPLATPADTTPGVRIPSHRVSQADRQVIGPLHGPSGAQVYQVARKDIDWQQLTAELGAKLDRPVAVMFEVDEGATAGELTLRDPETLEFIQTDQAVIDEVVDAHEPPEPPAAKALRMLNEATTIPDQLAAMREFMEFMAAREGAQAVALGQAPDPLS